MKPHFPGSCHVLKFRNKQVSGTKCQRCLLHWLLGNIILCFALLKGLYQNILHITATLSKQLWHAVVLSLFRCIKKNRDNLTVLLTRIQHVLSILYSLFFTDACLTTKMSMTRQFSFKMFSESMSFAYFINQEICIILYCYSNSSLIRFVSFIALWNIYKET